MEINGVRRIVIKYGGSIAGDSKATERLAEDIAVLREAGAEIVVIHGGGKDIDRMLGRLNLKAEYIQGLRVTGSAEMEIVEMVLSGRINKELTSRFLSRGVAAVGISGRDGRLIEAKRMYIEAGERKKDIGFVGEITGINSKLIDDLTNMGYVPVISPVAGDREGNAYNVNADYAAAAIGIALAADILAYLSDVDGLYRDVNDRGSLISTITPEEIEEYILNGSISGGMIPKMKCCIEAVRNGVRSVCLIGGNRAHPLLGLVRGEPAGTVIKRG